MPQGRVLTPLEYQILEEMRGIGNWHFKEKLFGKASHTYVFCLSYMAIDSSNDGMNPEQKTSKELARGMPSRYNEQAALLYLNIGQSCLMLENKDKSHYLGLAAALASHRALCFLLDVFEEKKQEPLPEEDAEKIIFKHMDRLMKAHLRLGKAEILCVNYPAAVSHLNVLLDFAHRCKNLCDIDALRNQVETISKALLKYASKDDTVPIPRPVTMVLAAAMPNYFCRAEMFRLAWNDSWAKGNWPCTETIDKVFACGRFERWEIFIVRQPFNNDSYLYFICGFEMRQPDRPSMSVLDIHSAKMEMGAYSNGAMVGDCLYLMTEPATSPDVMLCMRLGKDKGISENVEEVFTSGRPVDYYSSSIVTDGESLYLFGGCILNGGATSARNTLYTLKPGPTSSREVPLRWKVMPTGGMKPAARFGHGCWVQEGHLYVYGGIETWSHGAKGTADVRAVAGGEMHPLRTVDDLWRYDLKSRGGWRELEPRGTLPAARAHMGVAADGKRAFISGGVTGFEETRKELYLADIWMFNASNCSWMQVTPAANESRWMSARYRQACAVVGAGCLCTVGGCANISDCISVEHGLCFKLQTLEIPASLSFAPKGTQRDRAMELACEALVRYREESGHSVGAREMLAATKTGGCTFYTQNHGLLWGCMLTPNVVAGMPAHFQAILFPYRLRYGSERRQAGGSVSTLGAEVDPFHPTPRHLTAPCEVQVHMVAQSAQQNPTLEGTIALSSTVKVFGTVKAAVAYWRSTLPVKARGEPGWFTLDGVIHQVYTAEHFANDIEGTRPDGTPRGSEAAEKFTEFAYCIRQNPDKGSEDQIYVLSVTGHVFAAHLISHLSLENLDGAVVRQLLALKLCCRTLQLQHRLIFRAVRRPPCSCSHCGRTQLFHQGMETPEIKVCKGCHVVRYCSLQCQREAWPAHKEHCKLL